jgi:hypothetical protein
LLLKRPGTIPLNFLVRERRCDGFLAKEVSVPCMQ